MKTEAINESDIDLIKYAARNFPPNTKFVSLFGAKDIVSEKDSIKVDRFGDVYILCKSGNYRLIYNGKYWANTIDVEMYKGYKIEIG